MAELTVEKAPKQVRDMFNRGFTAFERGNTDYAIDLLFSCVEGTPDLLQARKYLRAAEIQKARKKKTSGLSTALATAAGTPQLLKGMALLKGGKKLEALVVAEKLLRQDVLNIKFIKFFVQVAMAADMPEAAIQTMEMIRDFHPEDVEILAWLGQLYQKMGRMKSAKECFEKLCEISPNDPGALKMFKDAMAMESITTDGWGQAESFRDLMKDKDQAVRLEQQNKAVKSDQDADDLIAETLQKIEKEPGNINYLRAVARLYIQKNMFAEAIAAIQKAIELSPGDPELDNFMSQTRVKQFDQEIAALEASGADGDAIVARQQERAQFIFDNLHERVQRYPNDLELRYELGVMLFENDYLDDAIQQFQRSQRSPKFRIKTFFYLALCFKAKKQYDMAVEQLEKAASETVSMDETKKNILYELGTISEMMGDRAKAVGYYKQIYQVDISFRDVTAKVEQGYGA